MKTLQEQYNLIKEGKGNKNTFMKSARSQFPNLFNNLSTFDTAIKVMKQKQIISEVVWWCCYRWLIHLLIGKSF